MRDGVETKVLAYFLYQPGAPRFFEVEDSAGCRLFVQFRGPGLGGIQRGQRPTRQDLKIWARARVD